MQQQQYDVRALKKLPSGKYDETVEYIGTYYAKSSKEAMDKLCEEYNIIPGNFHFSALKRSSFLTKTKSLFKYYINKLSGD